MPVESSATPASPLQFRVDASAGFYPIVYVRGFAPTSSSREDTFYDAYYGYAETAVDKRDAAPPQYLEPVVFEGQLIRLLKEYGYVDAANGGLALALSNAAAISWNPTRSLWISRFYDRDVLQESVRPIEDHARDLLDLISGSIPRQLKEVEGVDLGPHDEDYKVILIAHSMGGLLCRCLIQNIMAQEGLDPKRWIHRLVTIATPHRGIELSLVPDFLEDLVASGGNPLNTAIFKEPRMRGYLKLDAATPLHSLDGKFPEGRCLSVIGSDHESYSVVKKAAGGHSDGLVKQSNAYIEGAYNANVHRAHSGRQGIVNSFETYENVRRFLFGDTRVRLWFENLELLVSAPPANVEEFYDVEFSLSIRGTGAYLHQRKQNPCENAMRFKREQLPSTLHLHTGFMDTKLRTNGEPFSHFLLAYRVAQHRVRDGFLFDHQYPERTIYSESLELRVNLAVAAADNQLEYRWLSQATDLEDPASWQVASLDAQGVFRFPFLQASTITGDLCIQPRRWPDSTTESIGIDAAKQ